MKTIRTKFLLPLAALTLVSAACDPFPAKPGGDPAVVRVITYNGSLGTSNTVETVTGGNTVSTDFAEPDSLIRVQFNKPMDGSTIQGYSNYVTPPTDPDTVGIRNLPIDLGATPPRTVAVSDPGHPYDTCAVPSNLVLTGFEEIPGVPGVYDPATHTFVPGTGTYPVKTQVCYDPSSATDGGQLLLIPAVPMVYGTTYHIGGTVKDYEGKPVTLNVTLTVDKRPIPYGWDGYTTFVGWFDSGVATSYEVLWSATGAASSFTSLAIVDPAVDCDGVYCEIPHYELVPNTDYYYQVKETVGTTTTTRPAAQAPASTLSAITPTLGVSTTVTPPPVILKGIIRIAWGSVQHATGYDVETSTDGTNFTLFYHYTGALTAVPPAPANPSRTVYLGSTQPDPRTVPTIDGTLPSGSVHYVRVTPTFADLFTAQKGNVASKAAP